MKTIRIAIRDLQSSSGKQMGMVAFNNSQVEYAKWLVNEDESEDSPRRVCSARVKIAGIDRPIETDAEGLIATLKAMIGEDS